MCYIVPGLAEEEDRAIHQSRITERVVETDGLQCPEEDCK